MWSGFWGRVVYRSISPCGLFTILDLFIVRRQFTIYWALLAQPTVVGVLASMLKRVENGSYKMSVQSGQDGFVKNFWKEVMRLRDDREYHRMELCFGEAQAVTLDW